MWQGSSSHQVSSDDDFSLVSKQDMEREIGNQTWQFDSQRFARMLSSKTRKRGALDHVERLQNYDWLVDHSLFSAAFEHASEVLEMKSVLMSWNTEEAKNYSSIEVPLHLCHDLSLCF
jgi:hypothetical protein